MEAPISPPPPLILECTGFQLLPDKTRVIARPFLPGTEDRIDRIIRRVLSLTETAAAEELEAIFRNFKERHHRIEDIFERHFILIRAYLPAENLITPVYRKLLGAYFTQEYAYQSAALFNPSLVVHPDQSGLPAGTLRFVMSLRATGEGHISSLVFRTGLIGEDGDIRLDPGSDISEAARLSPNTSYDRRTYTQKLVEMGLNNDFSKEVLDSLGTTFTLLELHSNIHSSRLADTSQSQTNRLTADKMLWLAQSNYEVNLNPEIPLSASVIFPLSPSEQNGIEDARFTPFSHEDGSRTYFATYTAYDGKVILPQLIETPDFHRFRMITLNGRAVSNKGMALFPRKIRGAYTMLSRQDNDGIFLMFSDNIHFWNHAACIVKPDRPWEYVQMGNCGSPIETEAGWLVLTHGVGPMRQYCIGALLLDLEDPTKVLGRLSKPLIEPKADDRGGYVPNVVYTCGSLVHRGSLYIPVAYSDYKISLVRIKLADLLNALLAP